jgi:uncharacterized YigZ family protein
LYRKVVALSQSTSAHFIRIIPAGEVRSELTIERSRFIASAAPAGNVDQARAFIQRIRSEFLDASHNVPLFIIGHGAGVTMHCSDDGEPSGTAGRPALAVLQGSGLGDVAVVVTRYFGGIKLGTGGLVRAYSDAVRQVLAALPRAEKVSTTQLMAAVPYALLERLRQLVATLNGQIEEEEFAAEVTLTVRVRDEVTPVFLAGLKDLCRGAENVIVTQQSVTVAMPLGTGEGTIPEEGTSGG